MEYIVVCTLADGDTAFIGPFASSLEARGWDEFEHFSCDGDHVYSPLNSPETCACT